MGVGAALPAGLPEPGWRVGSVFADGFLVPSKAGSWRLRSLGLFEWLVGLAALLGFFASDRAEVVSVADVPVSRWGVPERNRDHAPCSSFHSLTLLHWLQARLWILECVYLDHAP